MFLPPLPPAEETWLRHVLPDPVNPKKAGWVIELPSKFRDLLTGNQMVFHFEADKRNTIEINRAWASDAWLAEHRKKEAKLTAKIEHKSFGRYDADFYVNATKGGSLGFVEVVSRKGPNHAVIHCLAATVRPADACRQLLLRFAEDFAHDNP